MKRACVIGWPVAHSRSPLIHQYWLKRYGIAGSYTREAVRPEELAGFLARLGVSGYSGCNVTLPHKETVFAAVNIADQTTERLGVVNTVFVKDGQLFGTSTDGEGFIANLQHSISGWSPQGKRIVLLGAGGAARAIAGALIERDAAEIVVANRTVERADALRRDLGERIAPLAWDKAAGALSEADLLVNATSLGMSGQPPLDLDLARLGQDAVVTDIVYAPLETELIRAARERGNLVVGGLGMLLHQAVRGFALWFGTTPEITDELYDLIARDIDPDYRRP